MASTAPPSFSLRAARPSRLDALTSACGGGIALPTALAEAGASHLAPAAAGALFAAGWAALADSILTAHAGGGAGPTAVAYLPGALATLTLAMTATVRRGDLDAADDDGSLCRARGWLFVAYVCACFAVAAAGAALVLAGGAWVGAAAVAQVVCILAASLLLFLGGGEGDGGGYGGYGAF